MIMKPGDKVLERTPSLEQRVEGGFGKRAKQALQKGTAITLLSAIAPLACATRMVMSDYEASKAEDQATQSEESYLQHIRNHDPEDGFYIQAGSFSEFSNYEKVMHALRAAGSQVTTDTVTTEVDGEPTEFFRVLVPPKEMKEDLENIASVQDEFKLQKPKSLFYHNGKASGWNDPIGGYDYKFWEANSMIVPHADIIDEAAKEFNVSPYLLACIIQAESGFDENICSPAGACGLGQTMPITAKDVEIEDLTTPTNQARATAKYARKLLDRFDNDLPLALAAYNAGPTAAKNGNYNNYTETVNYIGRVLGLYESTETLSGFDHDHLKTVFNKIIDNQKDAA